MFRKTKIALAVVAVGVVVGDASALDFQVGATASSPALCQPALPSFDGLIRKRPLAVQNEGSANAFVSCAFNGDYLDNSGVSEVTVYLINNNAVPTTVNCTLVNSHAGGLYAAYPKSVEVPANSPGGLSTVQWTTADRGGANFSRWVSLSCQLPPGTGLGHLNALYTKTIPDAP